MKQQVARQGQKWSWGGVGTAAAHPPFLGLKNKENPTKPPSGKDSLLLDVGTKVQSDPPVPLASKMWLSISQKLPLLLAEQKVWVPVVKAACNPARAGGQSLTGHPTGFSFSAFSLLLNHVYPPPQRFFQGGKAHLSLCVQQLHSQKSCTAGS